MNKTWEFFEGLEELVYAADMDTYELVYLNRKARMMYGIPSNDALTGIKCHELLRNYAFPCAVCTNQKLKPGKFEKWRRFDAKLGRDMLLWDTMVVEEGRRYRIEIAVDISGEEPQAQTMEQYQSLELMINNAVATALQESTPAETIQSLLQSVGHILQADRAYIFECNQSGGVDNTYEWVADQVEPQKGNLQNVPKDLWKTWYRLFLDKQEVFIEDLEEIRVDEPELYALLHAQQIRNLVAVPLYIENKLFGFYGVDNPTANVSDLISGLLQMMGYFICGTLKRCALVDELMGLSFLDQQTNAGNRRAFQGYIEHIAQQPPDSMGVVFCDITGLKRLNDTFGHLAGDKVIVHTCQVLKLVFQEDLVFRHGGDEFIVLSPEADEQSLQKKVEEFCAQTQKDSIVVAVGSVCGPIVGKDISEEINALLSAAETRMYEDKKRYYETHGIERREY